MPDRYSIARSLVIWASLLTWPVLYLLTSLTVVIQAALVLSAIVGMAYVAASEMEPYDDGQPQWRDQE